MKKPTFKTYYLIYTALLLLIVGILLFSVYRILKRFEASQADRQAAVYLEAVTEAIRDGDIAKLSLLSGEVTPLRFTSAEQFFPRLVALCQDKELSIAPSAKSFDSNKPLYHLICDDTPVAELQLNMISEEVKLGFLSIPEWELYSFVPSVDVLGDSYTLNVPEDFSVTANGIALTDADVISFEDGIETYLVSGFLETPLFSVKDNNQNEAKTAPPVPLSTADDGMSNMYSVPIQYERFDFTLPTDFSVALSEGTLYQMSREGYTVYSIYTAAPVELPFLERCVSSKDSIGNPLTFRETDGHLLPDYKEYTIVAPSCYRVYIDDVLLDSKPAAKQELLTPQYRDEPISLLNYRIGLGTGVVFRILDEKNNPVDFTERQNRIEVPLIDTTVTIPENFTLLVNKKAPEAAPVISENNAYQYVKEYTTLPKLLTYEFSGLSTAPTFTVVDNLGEETDYTITKSTELVRTEQAGRSELPETLRQQFDPLAYAKNWSLFMTDDLAGSLNGYYTIRDYLVRGSYYDTVAYQWATNIDITFISTHTFRNPAFSKESVTNVVVYNDNCISCDIYFEKHMQLTRTGKLQDDVFHRRIFFLYMDDTKDNKDNPHWVIADMQDI